MTSAYFKYRILTYINTILKAKFLTNNAFQNCRINSAIKERVYDLQYHSLYTITKVVKYIHEQTEQAIEFFKENKLGEIDLENTVGEAKRIREGQTAKKLREKQRAQGPLANGDFHMNAEGGDAAEAPGT